MQSSRLAYISLFVLFLANFLNGFDRQVIAVLAISLKDYWQLSDTQLGLLATAFELAFSLATVPIALVSDRWLRNRVLSLVVCIWSGAMAVTGLAPSFGILVLGRVLLGFGQAGYGSSANAWLSEIFPQQRLARVVSLHELGLVLGPAMGFGLGSVLNRIYGWRPVLYLAALPGFVVAAILWLLQYRNTDRAKLDRLSDRNDTRALLQSSLSNEIEILARIRTLIVSCAVGALLSFAGGAILFWLPSFAVRLHRMDEQTAGIVIGIIAVFAGITGVLTAGFFADYLLRLTSAGRLLLIGISSLVGTPIALVAILTSDKTLFLLATALAIFLFSAYIPCLGPLLTQVSYAKIRATAIGIYLFVSHILGFASGPAVIGWLSDETGSIRIALGLLPLVAVIAGLLALWGTRFVNMDITRVLHVEHESTGDAA